MQGSTPGRDKRIFFSPKVLTSSEAHQASYSMGSVSKLRIRGAIPLFPLCFHGVRKKYITFATETYLSPKTRPNGNHRSKINGNNRGRALQMMNAGTFWYVTYQISSSYIDTTISHCISRQPRYIRTSWDHQVILDVKPWRWQKRWKTRYFHRQAKGCRLLRNNDIDLANCMASLSKKTMLLTGPHETGYQFMNILLQHVTFVTEASLTLLTRKSFSSKCRPNILGASPGIGSILMHTSCPFLALSTALWLFSILVTTPKSTNWETKQTYVSADNDILT